MKKIKELQKRSTLGEGRNYGTGFSILNKIDDNYETFLPFTACKDYFNDFIYCESEKTTIGTAYGYNHKVLNCFDGKQEFYLGVNTLHYNNSNDKKFTQFDEHSSFLINNYKNLESFLNSIEKLLELPQLSEIELDEETLIIKAPIYWVTNSPLISVYTLLIRCFLNITTEELTKSLDVIFESHKPLIQADNYMIVHCKTFYNTIVKDKSIFVNIDYKKLNISQTYEVHNFGIVGFITKLKLNEVKT